MSEVKLVWAVPEEHIAFCARVSNPTNQGKDGTKLINYCAKHNHWSIFEMSSMCVEIHTTRAISAQLIRHRSFSFQEFSQRYALTSNAYTIQEARLQDTKNRQNSIEVENLQLHKEWIEKQLEVYSKSHEVYEWAIEQGIAKEVARAVLPINTQTKLYMSGTVRSWIHYLKVRLDPSTQKEHRAIALAVLEVFKLNYPVVAEAVGL